MSLEDDSTYDWKFTPVMRILRNPIYKGGMWEKTCTKTHFKQKSRGYIRINDRKIVEDVHEAIVSKQVWDTVQKNIDSHSKYKPSTHNIDNIFRGKLICDKCGHTLLIRTESKSKKPVLERTSYECTSYRRRGVKFCSSHRIGYLEIYNIVLQDINKQAEAFIKDKDTFINKLAKSFESSNISSSMKLQKELDKKQKRYDEIDNLFIKVYDDYTKNTLSEEKFNLISQNYEKEQKILKQQIQKLKQDVEKTSKSKKDIDDFTQIIKQCLGIKELTGTIISLLIDKIIVSDKQDIDGELTQKIKIIYRFVGYI